MQLDQTPSGDKLFTRSFNETETRHCLHIWMICRQNIEVAIESSIRMRSCQNAALWSAVKFRSILSIQLTILIRSSGTFYYNLAVKWDPSVQKKKHPKKVSRDYNRGAQEYRASKKVLYQLLVCGIGYLGTYEGSE